MTIQQDNTIKHGERFYIQYGSDVPGKCLAIDNKVLGVQVMNEWCTARAVYSVVKPHGTRKLCMATWRVKLAR